MPGKEQRRIHSRRLSVGPIIQAWTCPGPRQNDEPRTPSEAAGGRSVARILVLGLVGMNAWAFVGHDTPRGAASPTAAQRLADSAARASGPTTTVASVSTTTVMVTTTVPSGTTDSSRDALQPTVPTTPPATIPPTTAAPTTTAVAPAVSLHVTPSAAEFPSTPPPYWPMPIVPVTITNNGGVAVSSIVVHPVGVYSIPSNTCTTTLMPGHSCGAQVQFCPTAPGHYLDTLLVTGQDAVNGSPLHASITLDGTAT